MLKNHFREYVWLLSIFFLVVAAVIIAQSILIAMNTSERGRYEIQY